MKKFRSPDTIKAIPFIFILSLSFVSCRVDISGQYAYRPPEKINDGLDVGSLDEVNIDADLIEAAVNKIHEGKFQEVHSMLIFKDDKLVFEEYFQGHKYQWDGVNFHDDWVAWDRTMLHDIKSVTKSVTSTCIGIAVDQGFIKNIDQSIFDYLPEYQNLNNNGKEKITIEHLLTMTSGLEWDEWNTPLSSAKNDIIGLWFNCEDQVACILERPLVKEPGTKFTYSGGNMILLGEIIKNATTLKIDEFSRKYLFEPLGIDSSAWTFRYPNGVIEAAGSLEITPRDMVKIGVTFLNKGIWNGKQIISPQWSDKSVTTFAGNTEIKVPGEDLGKIGYAYTWWTKQISVAGKETHMFWANGWGGQKIIVIPELFTVVVFTAGNYDTKVKEFKILKKYIMPAIK